MGERLPHNLETEHKPEAHEAPQPSPERPRSTEGQAEHDALQKQVESLRASIEQKAKKSHELDIPNETQETARQEYGIDKKLKADTYKRSLRKIQANLNLPERALSRFVHQPTVESISNAAAKTVGRPSALAGGGFVALVGGGILLYMSRTHGFSYNYTVFIVLFMIGFSIGLITELVVRFVSKRRV